MELEVVEGKCPPPVSIDIEPAGCPEGGVLYGCYIIHFWCWSPGHGLCC